jgi:hypothetical protein
MGKRDEDKEARELEERGKNGNGVKRGAQPMQLIDRGMMRASEIGTRETAVRVKEVRGGFRGRVESGTGQSGGNGVQERRKSRVGERRVDGSRVEGTADARRGAGQWGKNEAVGSEQRRVGR